jgi:hypothetical protein
VRIEHCQCAFAAKKKSSAGLLHYIDECFHTFLIVLFIAPVTPELQCEPKLMHDIKITAHSFASSGGGLLPSSESLSLSLSDDSSEGVDMSLAAGSDTTSTTVFETDSPTGMIPIDLE